jgi:hypothetical protein
MPWVGFEPTIPVFEGAKTVHALDHATIVIGTINFTRRNLPNKLACDLYLGGGRFESRSGQPLFRLRGLDSFIYQENAGIVP